MANERLRAVMTAHEAREIATGANSQVILNEISEEILEAAKQGENYIEYVNAGWLGGTILLRDEKDFPRAYNVVIQTLSDKGYETELQPDNKLLIRW